MKRQQKAEDLDEAAREFQTLFDTAEDSGNQNFMGIHAGRDLVFATRTQESCIRIYCNKPTFDQQW